MHVLKLHKELIYRAAEAPDVECLIVALVKQTHLWGTVPARSEVAGHAAAWFLGNLTLLLDVESSKLLLDFLPQLILREAFFQTAPDLQRVTATFASVAFG